MNKRIFLFAALMVCFGVLISGGKGRWAGQGSEAEIGKSLDAYWNETDLSEMDFVRLLKDENCRLNERNYLACVNAISGIAERLRMKFTSKAELLPMGPEDMEKRLTEKSDLQPWLKVFADSEQRNSISFLMKWIELKEHISDKQKMNSIYALGVNSFLSVSKDPHTYIVPLAYYEEVLSQSEGKAPNMGFVARRIRGGALVRKVFTESPAERSGLKKGDRIVELNGRKVSELHSAEFSELIRGQVGGRLLLKVLRTQNAQEVEKDLEILPGSSRVTSVEHRVVYQNQSRLGVVTINKFARETCSLTRRAVIELIESSVQGLILDLRDNPGGQVDEAACVAGLFVPEDSVIFQTKYLDATKLGETYWSEGPELYTGPLAILINGGSASAAEIVAGALKDLGRAVLVGERSFGKGSFQDGTMWRSRSKIALFQTQGFYYFPSGWTPQIVGLEPDLPVKLGEAETLREEDLYLVPLRPIDLWDGPQSLSWLHQSRRCQNDSLSMSNEDIQVTTALDWIRCGDDLARAGEGS